MSVDQFVVDQTVMIWNWDPVGQREQPQQQTCQTFHSDLACTLAEQMHCHSYHETVTLPYVFYRMSLTPFGNSHDFSNTNRSLWWDVYHSNATSTSVPVLEIIPYAPDGQQQQQQLSSSCNASRPCADPQSVLVRPARSAWPETDERICLRPEFVTPFPYDGCTALSPPNATMTIAAERASNISNLSTW